MVNLEHILALHHLTSANAIKAHRYISSYGSVESALDSAPELANWKEKNCWKRDLETALKNEISLISFFDPNYPNALKTLADPPLLLYVKGMLEQHEEAIALVGTRLCSTYGSEMAEKLGSELAENSFSVVSGLARGIDTHAHKGALKGGKTIAILGSGLSQIYPRENIALAEAICQKGAIISEYPMQSHPEKHFFPKRNRLVSALSQAALLIEAPLKSGAMITMEMAASQNKICLALPGPVDRESFRGNHSLIKTQKAHLVENSQDVLSLLKPGMDSVKIHLKKRSSFLLDPEEEELVKQLPSEEICLEEISLRTHLPISKLNSLLMRLVLKQVLREYPGKFYKKVHY